MRLPAFIAMGAVLAAATACAPANNDTIGGGAPARNDGIPTQDRPDQRKPDQRRPDDSVPPAAAGKISADQVGKLSPVPAFQGGGANWSVEILATGDMRHSVKLITGDDVQTGTAIYRPSENAPSPIVLTGTLYATQGDRALRITLARGECRDDAGRTHLHGVRIEIAGATALQGCGDLAMY
jgi:hypothetical protein